MKLNPHSGSNFDEFLLDNGILKDVEVVATKRVISYLIEKLMKEKSITVTEMARRMNTSRSSVSRLLDPENKSITLNTLGQASKALGKKLRITLEN
ncbi:MAG: XRE family transcriptional regulator [Caldisericia bacterium]|nr:XRE family transcriptional regulator [Caldisericia bacterium]